MYGVLNEEECYWFIQQQTGSARLYGQSDYIAPYIINTIKLVKKGWLV